MKMAKRRTLENITSGIPKSFKEGEAGKPALEDGKPVVQSYWRYSDLVELVCNTPMDKGITYKEMKSIYNVLAEVEDHPETIKLRDEDVKKLQSLVEKFEWGFTHKEIVKFCDAVMALLDSDTE